MARFQVRRGGRGGGGNDDFDVQSVRLLEARTRGFILKTVTVGGMIALIVAEVVFAVRGDSVQLTATVSGIATLLSFVLGRYFDKVRMDESHHASSD